MKLLQSLIIITAFIATNANNAVAQQQTEWKQATSGGYTYKYVTNDPMQTRFYTLKNGLTVILSPTKKAPRIQTIIAVRTGSNNDPATHTGLAHYLEHLLFKGTDKYGTLDWSKEKPLLDKIAALYEQYNKVTDANKRKEIYKEIDRVSGEAAKFAIANEYDKMMTTMGAIGTNAHTWYDQTTFEEDIPGNAVDKYLAVQAERFRAPVFRLFHTELEAVYEEKNRSLDDDYRKELYAMFTKLFPNSNYGKQTTIGTVEHLKNPSLLEIRKYYETYYVPNNMAMIMCGDFNPDEMVKKVDKAFAYMKPKPVPTYKADPEQPITSPITTSVTGSEAERITIGYRFPGAAEKDAMLLRLMGAIMTNGSTGIIDRNLVLKQRLLSASADNNIMKDCSVFSLYGNPLQGQSLDDAKYMLLAQIDSLKKGNFPDDLIPAIVNNERKGVLQDNESYNNRANSIMNDYIQRRDWKDRVDYVNDLSKITKADIVAFANKYLGNNYVVVYKRQGVDTSIVKVDKPHITPVEVNREAQSPFLSKINAMPENKIEPVWLDFKKDIQRAKSGPYEVMAVQNKDNALFRLYYQYETGSWSNKLLGIASSYLYYIGTKNKSVERINKDFYNIASSFNISVNQETSTISIEGLQDHFGEAVTLFEDVLHHCQPDQAALEDFIARVKKARIDAKQNKDNINSALQHYALYGPENPYNKGVLTNADLDALKAEDVVAALHTLADYKHRILYYGPETANEIAVKLQKLHPAPASFKPLPPEKKFVKQDQAENRVLFAHYDMVQAEVSWIRNEEQYNASLQPTISIFNEYFGAGMGSIVFQTIRESKALAYSTYAFFSTPERKEDRNNFTAYVGAQADKFNEAVAGMNELLTTLPQSDKALENAKEGLCKSLATQRITQDGILFSYLGAERMGRDYDIRKNIYEATPKFTFADLKSFHDKELSHKPYTYCIVASQDKLKEDDMKKLGTFKKLSLEELFGY
jgi:predicted Zn-dependent peptidase